MNIVCVTGRLSKDPDIHRDAAGEVTFVRGNIAVDRDFKREGQPTADFIPIVVFGSSAKFVAGLTKGVKLEIRGRLQSGRYQKENGETVYTLDVVAEQVRYGESRAAAEARNAAAGGGTQAPTQAPVSTQTPAQPAPAPAMSQVMNGFMDAGDIEDLPFR